MRRSWSRIALYVGCFALSSCDIRSSSDAGSAVHDPDATAGCDLLEGTYAFEYRRRSGDCDDIEVSLEGFDEQLQIFPEDVRALSWR